MSDGPNPGHHQTVEDALNDLRSLRRDDPRRQELHERIVEEYLPVMRQIARRYSNRGEPTEDLVQTAMLGLMKAIHGFDLNEGRRFISYLIPTATGEVKRHFRDHTWAVRVPRQFRERRSELNRTTMELTQHHGRSPTIEEIAGRLDMTTEQTRELIAASGAYSALSLDVPSGEEEETPLGDSLGSTDLMMELVVDRESLKSALAGLAPRERGIVVMRFCYEMSQADIARRVGCSQVHVSRLLSQTLAQLHRWILAEG